MIGTDVAKYQDHHKLTTCKVSSYSFPSSNRTIYILTYFNILQLTALFAKAQLSSSHGDTMLVDSGDSGCNGCCCAKIKKLFQLFVRFEGQGASDWLKVCHSDL